ncbi:MAG: hypothetical protein EZS28_038556 [Streblomastix strix]|uniref:Reverse transcriptase domain-containing protein n=1 Tax=Streblomastix strix TaxID=222440 RepID=A0A5J4U6F7_9EUKA|nr:MAG: hypothetical protein EZS28_038556 [Streblomastix strix]
MTSNSNDLEGVSVPNRLIANLEKWNLIGGQIYILLGLQPNLTSIEDLNQLESIQRYWEFRAPGSQMIEYVNQLKKEIKDGGKVWKILDCRQVNKITNLMKFKMEGTEFIEQLLAPHDYATTFDLENAFHHAKVSNSLLLYFGFTFLVKTLTYRRLPFGYKNSPFIFNKTLLIALKEIRK